MEKRGGAFLNTEGAEGTEGGWIMILALRLALGGHLREYGANGSWIPEGRVMPKTAKKLLLGVVLGVLLAVFCLIMLFVIAVNLMTEGSMPAEAEAIAVRDEMLRYMQEWDVLPAEEGASPLPETVQKLSPLGSVRMDHGVILVFRRRYVERFGYLYLREGEQIPNEMAIYCREVAPGVYYYHDPG